MPHTYCYGVRFKTVRGCAKGSYIPKTLTLTTRQLVSICQAMEREFASAFGGEWTLRPAPISRGGILFVSWPGKTARMYKSMRFGNMCYNDYPWIKTSTWDEWQSPEHKEAVLFTWDAKLRGCISIQALYGAPCFTVQELRIVRQIFEAHGIPCLTYTPPQRLLVQYAEELDS